MIILKTLGILISIGSAMVLILTLISVCANWPAPSEPRYDDDWLDDESSDLFLVVANSWLDRNGWVIGRLVLFCIGLRILLTCTGA